MKTHHNLTYVVNISNRITKYNSFIQKRLLSPRKSQSTQLNHSRQAMIKFYLPVQKLYKLRLINIKCGKKIFHSRDRRSKLLVFKSQYSKK